jgi:hypothetical protein
VAAVEVVCSHPVESTVTRTTVTYTHAYVQRERERESQRVRESESQRETKKRMIVLIGKSLIANRICVPGREKHERVDG